MSSQKIGVFNKLVYGTIGIFLMSLAYSEALKSISLICMLILFVYAILEQKINISRDGIGLSIVLHTLFAILGIWIGINTEESLNQVSDVLKILLVFLFFREMDFKFITFEKILNLLIYGFLFALILGLYAYYFQGMDFIKLRSVGSINRSAVYMVLMLMLLLPFAFRQAKKRNIDWQLIAFLTVVSIILGASRMAVLSLLLLVPLFLYLKDALRLKHILLIVILFIIFLILIPELFPESRLSRRISQGLNDPARIQIWIATIKYFLESNNWLLGIGIGNSIFIDVRTFFGQHAITTAIDNTHQLYLDMLLERGILGLLTFLGFMTLIMKRSLRCLKDHPIYISIFLMSSAILIMGLANITFRYEFALLFVSIVGLSLNKTVAFDRGVLRSK